MNPTYFRRWHICAGWHLEEWILYPDGRAKCWYEYIPVAVKEAPDAK